MRSILLSHVISLYSVGLLPTLAKKQYIQYVFLSYIWFCFWKVLVYMDVNYF
ncbi:hypothetical protein Hanom_Chr11g00982371 [Helianthus anomalus]